ncbi:hypothetical protein VKT23_012963 [Stygiomarasmius scandens]|uniref:Uncharacterized protein n=1 Tax=Marasmiellus scandens TaxID=2682957 RepID=A0ABR1J4T7_9AGAR
MNGYIQAPPSAQLFQLQAQQSSRAPKALMPLSRLGLHKAVLIRSAHKAARRWRRWKKGWKGVLAEDKNDEEKEKFEGIEEGKDVRLGNVWPFRLLASPTKRKEKQDSTMDVDTDTPAPIHEDEPTSAASVSQAYGGISTPMTASSVNTVTGSQEESKKGFPAFGASPANIGMTQASASTGSFEKLKGWKG